MTKRLPQEIADFYGCYLVQSKEGLWYLLGTKPKVEGSNWIGDGKYPVQIDERLISVSANHDWTKLYEPHAKDPIEVFKDIQARHQSEVHVHQEYDIVCGGYPEQLSIKVTQLIHEGWKPVGGIVCLPPAHREDSETFYQAMVRGIE